jgi:hypothetical protein
MPLTITQFFFGKTKVSRTSRPAGPHNLRIPERLEDRSMQAAHALSLGSNAHMGSGGSDIEISPACSKLFAENKKSWSSSAGKNGCLNPTPNRALHDAVFGSDDLL